MITATDILSAPASTVSALVARAFVDGNEAGRGFDPDADIEGEEPIFITGGGIAVYRMASDRILLVGDANGAWGIEVIG